MMNSKPNPMQDTRRPETCDHCKRTQAGQQSCCPFHYVVKVLFAMAVILMSSAALAQSSAACYEARPLHKTVCEFEDGTATVTDHTYTVYAVTDYTAAQWVKLKPMIQAEADKILAKREAEKQAALAESAKLSLHSATLTRAAMIFKKKDCLAAGFAWSRGNCVLKGDQ